MNSRSEFTTKNIELTLRIKSAIIKVITISSIFSNLIPPSQYIIPIETDTERKCQSHLGL